MATIGQVTEAVYRGRYEDQMSAGVKAATDALKQNSAAVVENEEKVTRATQSAKTLVNRNDELTKATNALTSAQRALTTAQETLTKGVAAGEVTEAQAARALQAKEAAVTRAQERVQALSQAYGQATPAVTNAGTAMATSATHAERLATQTRATGQQIAALTPQLNDVAVSLAGGQSPFLVMMQQGTQITQIFGGLGNTIRQAPTALISGIGSGLREIGAALGPVGLGAAAVATALGVMFSVLNGQETRLSNLRATFRAIPGDFRQIAQETDALARQISASVLGITRDDATGALTQLRQGGAAARLGFDRDQLRDLATLSGDLARVLGTDIPDAARKLADAMRDPAALVDDLARRGFPGYDQALRRAVEAEQIAGNEARAFALALGPLREHVQGATQDVGPWEQAVQRLQRAWESFKQTIGPSLIAAATAILEAFTALAGVLDRAAAALDRIGASRGWLLGPMGGLLGESIRAGQWVGGAIGGAPGSAGTGRLGGYIDQAAAISGLDPALIAQIQRQEGVFRNGQWVTSSAGAVGPMQVMPGTYSEMQRRYGIDGDVTDERSNIVAGALYLREMIDRFGGDLRSAVAAYNAGPGRVDAVRSGLSSTLPAETINYVGRFVGSGYSGPGVVGPVNLGAVPAGTPTAVLPPTVVTAQAIGPVGTSTESDLDRADRIARGELARYPAGASVEDRRRSLQDTMTLFEGAIPQAQNTAQLDRLLEGYRSLREEYERTLTPAQEMDRQLRLQGVSAGIADQAQRTLTQRMAEYDEEIRRTTAAPDPAARARYQAEQIRQINAELGVNITLTDRAATAQGRIAQAFLESEAAGRRQELVERARAEIIGNSVLSTDEQTQAINRRVAALERERQATLNSQSAQRAAAQQSEIDAAMYERSLITMGQGRTGEMAAYRERQAVLRAGGDANSPESLARISKAREFANIREQNSQLQNSWNELANTAEQAFGQIGNAITDALMNGKSAMEALKSAARTVVSALINEFMKLAIINPILNAVFGGTRGTFGGVFDLLTGGGGGVQVGVGSSSNWGSVVGSAAGNAFWGGQVVPFAAGGVVNGTQVVPMAMMGEAGPEAIMPLRRGKDGKLGVAADGGGGAVINMGDINVQAPSDTRGATDGDPAAIERLSSFVSALVKQQVMEVLMKELRGGGMLSAARA